MKAVKLWSYLSRVKDSNLKDKVLKCASMLLKGFKPIIFTRVSRILIARPLFNQRMQCKTNSWYCCLCYPSDSLNSTFNVWCFLLLSSIWPLVSVIACMIRCKALVPHDIIWAAMGATLIITEALFWSMTVTQQLWELPKRRYSRLVIMPPKQLAEH